MKSLHRKPALQLLILCIGSWFVFTTTHELGHIVGGWFSGGSLQVVDLWPWHLPLSIFEPDPHPLVTLWSGPLLGALVPVSVAVLVRRQSMWFIGWFCVFANGVYLATAWLSGDRFLDTAQLLRHGAHPATIALYCLSTIVPGYIRLRQSFISILIVAK